MKKVLAVIGLAMLAACSPDQYKEITITLPVCGQVNNSSFSKVGAVRADHSTWQMTKMYGNADSVVVTLKCIGQLVSSEN